MGDMLKGIFYAQFDNVLGPRIAFQHPSGYVSDLNVCFASFSLPEFPLNLILTALSLVLCAASFQLTSSIPSPNSSSQSPVYAAVSLVCTFTRLLASLAQTLASSGLTFAFPLFAPLLSFYPKSRPSLC